MANVGRDWIGLQLTPVGHGSRALLICPAPIHPLPGVFNSGASLISLAIAAVLAMMSSNIGARQPARANRIAWIALGLSVCAMACVSVLAITAPDLEADVAALRKDALP